jgi:hypothetical protein
MEEDIRNKKIKHVSSIERRIDNRLEKSVLVAEERIAYENAHDEKLLLALDTIRNFLIDHRRVCYGGTAMNEILPKKLQFYNPDVDLPDYDFFTPDVEGDIEILIKKLQDAGFEDAYSRVGIHEGTKKILVNFTPIADMTAISPNIYAVFLKRAYLRNGIYYTDPDILRMMMYLEISRPKGMVSRWEKVFERLQLINRVFPPKIKGPRNQTRKVRASKEDRHITEQLFNYCIQNQRTVLTGPLDEFYSRIVFGQPHMNLLDSHTGVVGFLTPEPKEDGFALQRELGGYPKLQTFLHVAKDEIVPEYVELRHNGKPVAILFKETACHAYLNFSTEDGRSLAIASLDTLITLYYTFAIFTVRARTLFPNIQQKIARFIQLAEANRGRVDPNIPSFPLSCRGYQKGMSTLMREKFHRIRREKKEKRRVAAAKKETTAKKDE